MQEGDPAGRNKQVLGLILMAALVTEIVFVSGYSPGSASATASPFSGPLPPPAATIRLTELPQTLLPTPTFTATPESTRHPTPEPIPLPEPGERTEVGGVECIYINVYASGDTELGDASLHIDTSQSGLTSIRISRGVLAVRSALGSLTGVKPSPQSFTFERGEAAKVGLFCPGENILDNVDLRVLLPFSLPGSVF